ncbi:MAG: hypothetical protein SF069_05405 [Phycisphaerae bacterium]|nr:hypothetical protein [Phycisphaerae bacterium]
MPVLAPTPFLFWLLAVTGSVVAGWWLSVRPGASMRDMNTPVAALSIVMALVLAMLAMSGQNLDGFLADTLALLRGY